MSVAKFPRCVLNDARTLSGVIRRGYAVKAILGSSADNCGVASHNGAPPDESGTGEATINN
jgi:hypothetical protein